MWISYYKCNKYFAYAGGNRNDLSKQLMHGFQMCEVKVHASHGILFQPYIRL